MDGFLSSIGALALVALMIYILCIALDMYKDKQREKSKLKKHAFLGEDMSDSKDKKTTIEQKKVVEANESKLTESKRKELIMDRVYSYKYEDSIYRIFSPYAVENKNAFSEHQKWLCDTSLELNFVSYELGRILLMSEYQAIDLLREFKEHHLVEWTLAPYSREYNCSMGDLLIYHWDIISKNDKNFSSWIDSHNDIELKESVEKRRKHYLTVKNRF